MDFSNFIQELKRRNVIKVATAYAIAGWLIIQIATSVFPAFAFPEWTTQFVIILTIIGLPISLIIAWAFELTPEGLKTTQEVDEDDSITHNTGKKLNGLIIGGLCLLVVFLITERVFFASSNLIDSPSVITNVSDKSIAVLPFDDFNAGGDQEYFADGLTEEILNSLAKTPDLLVASRTSSFQYKDQNVDIIKIADSLGVAHILEGSIRESSDKYRITAQLIRASDGFHLWSETYDRPKTDIIDIQEEIAFEIATALETAMNPEELRNMLEAGTSSIEAYKLYLEGLYMISDAETGNNKQAYELFEKAKTKDPEFASAHFLAAKSIISDMTLVNIGDKILDVPYEQKLRMVDERLSMAIRHASEIDRLEYLSTQAFTNMELRKSVDYMMQYLTLRPSSFNKYYNLILTLSALGDYEQAKKYYDQAQEYSLDNESNVSLSSVMIFWSRNWENADPWMQEKLDKFPYSEMLAYQSHRIMLWRGEYERAREVKKRLRGLQIPVENFAIADIREACTDGNTDLANQIYEESVQNTGDLGFIWIALKILNRNEEAHKLIQILDENKQFINVFGFAYYPHFDYTQYPNMNEILERENHTRGPVLEIPYKCGR
tara:strand:+ start:9482 stop:11299 length:1818 start_codon:yes stop_codon:yes gene_type:complete